MAKAPKRTLRPESETRAANDKAEASAKRVGNMTRLKRSDVIAEHLRLMEEYAPSMEAASSDLLAVLQAVGMEFVKRYYPDCERALFTVCKYAPNGSKLSYWVQIPIPITGDELKKGGA